MKKEKKNITEPKEWPDTELCPCGSGEIYKKCCKQKSIKYYKKNENEYIKSIPMEKEVEKVLRHLQAEFKRILGRNPGQDDYVMAGVLNNNMENFTRKLKYDAQIPNDYVYAYDRTGLMLSEHNIDKLSDVEIMEFKDAMKEYNDLMEEEIEGDSANLLQVAETANMYIKELWEETVGDVIYVLNHFIKQTKQEIGIEVGFSVKNRKDFLVYCAYKTTQHLDSLNKLIEEGYKENSLTVVRFIYEILLNVIAYRNDKELFNNKILPLAGLDEGKFERKSNSNKNTLIEKATGKEYYCGIKKIELAKKAGKNYELLYDTLYEELSGFIHLDTLAAKKIFAETDNFLDVDECYTAGILSLVFTMEIIGELSKFEENKEQLRKDLQYFINSRIEKMSDALEVINNLDEKSLYKVIKETLLEYKKST